MPVPRTSRAVAAPIFFTSSGSLPWKISWDVRARILNWSGQEEEDGEREREQRSEVGERGWRDYGTEKETEKDRCKERERKERSWGLRNRGRCIMLRKMEENQAAERDWPSGENDPGGQERAREREREREREKWVFAS